MKDWDAQLYRTHAGFVSDLGQPVVDLLAPRTGERILDVGCGDGVLSEKLAGFGCEVVGIDASPEMVAAARERGVDARLMNAADLEFSVDFERAFDAVFSNAALHWMHPMEAVVRGVCHVLKPGGRFAAEFGGEGNVQRIRDALYEGLRTYGVSASDIDPWRFPSADEYEELLTGHGFKVEFIDCFDRPTELPGGMTDWVDSVGRLFLRQVPSRDRPEFLSNLENRLAPYLRGDDGTWWADYVRLRVRAVHGRRA